jgi:NAD(P)-dependent dehydrogenase (short-subunit alcohol dehydrogenase family)
MTRVDGVRVMVTGATSGLGRAMAGALIESDAAVAVTSRERSRADAVAAELGPRAVGIDLDVRDEGSVHAAVEEVHERLGGVDMLVNNAGIGMRTVNPRFLSHPQPFWEVSPSGFRDVVDTKLTGSFLVARAIVPRMLAVGGGRIVRIPMNEQTMTRRGFVPYGPSGAGVEALAHHRDLPCSGSARQARADRTSVLCRRWDASHTIAQHRSHADAREPPLPPRWLRGAPLQLLVDGAPHRLAHDVIELLEQLVGARARPVEVLRFNTASWPRARTGSATTSTPPTTAWPLVGRTRVVSMPTVVVLPAPFGPSSPNTSPGSTANEIPSTAFTGIFG